MLNVVDTPLPKRIPSIPSVLCDITPSIISSNLISVLPCPYSQLWSFLKIRADFLKQAVFCEVV